MSIIDILKLFYRKITKKDFEKLPIFYINGSQTLPPPLSSQEESEILARIEDDDAKQILVERNLRLVVYIAKKFENTGTRNRRFNFNWNNWINEGNKHV